MTRNMKETLERLYKAKGHADFVALSTAWALERRGLVAMPNTPRQRTAGGQFPEYWATLTSEGSKWCLAHYQRVGRHDIP